ncbi:Chaperone protein DnaJ 1 [Nymphaea thermarum]|nr:Chaperone protein DnaJ 1 [Nymphaea thermarum]
MAKDSNRGIKKATIVSHVNEGNEKETTAHHAIEGSNDGNRYNGHIKKATPPASHDDGNKGCNRYSGDYADKETSSSPTNESKRDNPMAQSNSSSSMGKYPYPYNLNVANFVSIKLNQEPVSKHTSLYESPWSFQHSVVFRTTMKEGSARSMASKCPIYNLQKRVFLHEEWVRRHMASGCKGIGAFFVFGPYRSKAQRVLRFAVEHDASVVDRYKVQKGPAFGTEKEMGNTDECQKPISKWIFFLFFWFQDYYKILEVDYDATYESIRLSYRRLALKWHPDKHKGDKDVTAKFQEINEAYRVLSDPAKRLDYDLSGNYDIDKYTLREYLSRFKAMILTCNGLGMGDASTWYFLSAYSFLVYGFWYTEVSLCIITNTQWTFRACQLKEKGKVVDQ